MKTPQPTPIELELLKHLWRSGQLSPRELHDRTEAFTQWSFSSTRKTLERMLEKGLISAGEVHGVRIYRAKVRKLPLIAGMWRDFSKRVLGAGSGLPMAHFAESDFLSKDEIDELKRMLAKDE